MSPLGVEFLDESLKIPLCYLYHCLKCLVLVADLTDR